MSLNKYKCQIQQTWLKQPQSKKTKQNPAKLKDGSCRRRHTPMFCRSGFMFSSSNPSFTPPTPPYIHSVFMSAGNKARGSVHAGGGVAANSWQLFKYLLSPLTPFLYIPTLVSVGAATGGGLREGEARVGVRGCSRGVNQPPTLDFLIHFALHTHQADRI